MITVGLEALEVSEDLAMSSKKEAILWQTHPQNLRRLVQCPENSLMQNFKKVLILSKPEKYIPKRKLIRFLLRSLEYDRKIYGQLFRKCITYINGKLAVF